MKTVAKILLINPSGKILVLTRSNTHPHYPLHIDFPGGVVDPGETPDEAVIRELREETGIFINEDQVEKVMEKINGTTLHILYSGKVQSIDPKITLSWEHIKHQWLDPNELVKTNLYEGLDGYFLDVIGHMKNPNER